MKKFSLEKLDWKDRLTFVKNIPLSEDDFKSLGTKFQIIKFKPYTEVKPHFHKKRTELFYVVNGKGLIIINDKKYRVKPNDFFLCEIGDVHQFNNDTEEEFVVLVFRTNETKEDDLFWA